MVTPPASTGRIAQLDALRGLAVIGIVWMNVYAFALPLQAYYNPVAWGGESLPDRIVWATQFVFVEDKFRTLFAMLFGAGCVMLIEKGGERSLRAHYARMAVLFAIGAAHSILLASNDVLRAYALAGLAIPLLAPLSHRALYAVAIGLVAAHVGGGMVAFGGALVDYYAGRSDSDATLMIERRFGVDEPALRYALELGREGFGERAWRRIEDFPQHLQNVALSIPLNLAAIALGMATWKDRLLAREWRMFRMQRLAAVCGVAGILGSLALAVWVESSQFSAPVVAAASLVLSTPFDMLLGLAYAALAMALFTSGGWATHWLATVGRLSLTNYLMTSLIFAAMFASWGLSLFGEVSRAQTFALSFVAVIAMLAWSPIWSARLGQGPFERLWRGATRLLA